MKRYSGLPTSKKKRIVLALAGILGLFPACQTICAGEPAGPHIQERSGTQAPLTTVQLFQRYISPVDGERCTMWPTCSHYARDAVKKHGLLKGWIMTCDRLLRCGGDETHTREHVTVRGVKYYPDPVEKNDFWWYGDSEK